MMNESQVREILSRITYKDDWKFKLEPLVKQANPADQEGYLLHIEFYAADNFNTANEPLLQVCRKWYLPQESTITDIVRTAFKAVMAAEEHEASELFRYEGKIVYNPHSRIE